MKKLTLLLFFIVISISLISQTPQAFKYQAVVRDNLGAIVANQEVSFRISIHDETPTGTIVYQEIHDVTTNEYGLVNLEVGNGDPPITGFIEDIDWGTNEKFMEVELDPLAGIAYVSMGTTQLLTVPYSLYAESTGDTTRWRKNMDDLYYNNGNIGVGTNTPQYNLDIYGSSMGQSRLRLTNPDNSKVLLFGSGNDLYNSSITFHDGDALRFMRYDGGYTELMRIQSNGNLGIGTDNPTEKLEVADTIYSSVGGFKFPDGSVQEIAAGTGGVISIDDLTDGKTIGFSVFLGSGAGANDDGTTNRNTAIGFEALHLSLAGFNNSANGYNALYSNTSGRDNVASGHSALYSNTTGGFNVGLGMSANRLNQSGSQNTIIGYEAGRGAALHSKNGNVFIGYQAGYNETEDNKLYIENSDTTAPLIGGDFSTDEIYLNGNVGVGTQNPDGSALLDLNSNSQGFLLPRMSAIEIAAISNPANGLLVFNTTSGKLYIYIEILSEWKQLDFGINSLSSECGFPFIDSRDGQSYNTVKIGDQCWMAENLNIGIRIDAAGYGSDNDTIEKYCYNDIADSCDVFGGLYHWNEMMQYSTSEGVQGICPTDWHIPTDNEWKILEGLVDSQSGVGDPVWNNEGWRGFDAGGNLKESGFEHWNPPNTDATNSSGFTSLPGGYLLYTLFADNGNKGVFWTSTQYNSSYNWMRLLQYDSASVARGYDVEELGISVRCIKD